jgi:hypothetical protein
LNTGSVFSPVRAKACALTALVGAAPLSGELNQFDKYKETGEKIINSFKIK